MKITPLEIRQKTFEKKLRGYDKDDVQAFLLSLSNEWERVLDDNKELRIKLEQAEKEVEKLREVESSLFKTLKTAEDTGANLIDQATKAAELHMKEVEMNSEALLSESKNKARGIIEKAESEARNLVDEMQQAVKDLEQNYRTIENHRDNLIGEIRNLSNDLLERTVRTSKAIGDFKMEDHLKKVRDLARRSQERITSEQLETTEKKLNKQYTSSLSTARKQANLKTSPEKKAPAKAAPAKKTGKDNNVSFFDELD